MDILGFASGAAWTVVFFIVAISVIVAIHEYGHYIVGRWTGIHAEVFSIGFGPVLFSRVDRRGTRWQVAAIPLGGYVKFLGDADAASVRADLPSGLSADERRHTMAGAPLWARSLTVAAGPVANFLLTFVIIAGALIYTGLPQERPSVGHLWAVPGEQTLQQGDIITSIAGIATPDNEAFGAALKALPRVPQVEFGIERDGQPLTVVAPHPQPGLLSAVDVKSAAIDAGLRAGDVVIRADGRDIITFEDLVEVVRGSDGRTLPLTVWRNGETFDLELTPRRRDVPRPAADGGGFETRWLLGAFSGLSFDPATRPAGVIETITTTASQMWTVLTTILSGLWHLITGQISTCNMSGMIGMAETMGDAAKSGTMSFVMMLASLSMMIGIVNLLPIPVLDGGHLVFHAWEAVTGKPPADGALRVLLTIGLTLLLSLMAFGLWNDVTCI